MANYDVKYSCGHEGEVKLFGKHDDRDRKIAWYERKGLCRDCYIEHKREQERREGPKFFVRFLWGSHRKIEIVCVNSYQIKEQLKARGWHYDPDAHCGDGLGGMLSLRTSPGWTIVFAMCNEQDQAALEGEVMWIIDQGWPCPDIQDQLSQVLSAAILGRADLLPNKKEKS